MAQPVAPVPRVLEPWPLLPQSHAAHPVPVTRLQLKADKEPGLSD